MRRAALAIAAALAATTPLAAQAPVTGYVSMLFDVVGRPGSDGGGRDADVEWRPRVFLDHRREIGDHVRLRLSGYVEGLVADRHQADSPTTDLIARPQELYVELVSERADLRIGYSRVVWGRLDELQPTDVVNPLDLAKFFFEGRAEARIPVAMAACASSCPARRPSRASSSPSSGPGDSINWTSRVRRSTSGGAAGPPGSHGGQAPVRAGRNLQGGARLQTTSGRVDWGVSAYRGFEPFGVFQLTSDATAVEEVFPRFTMVGGDFETVRGEWGIRGEVAAFVNDSFQSAVAPRAHGRSLGRGRRRGRPQGR